METYRGRKGKAPRISASQLHGDKQAASRSGRLRERWVEKFRRSCQEMNPGRTVQSATWLKAQVVQNERMAMIPLEASILYITQC